MTLFQTIAALLTAAALAAYLNHRFFRLPMTIALMGFSLCLSVLGIVLSDLGLLNLRDAVAVVGTINFSSVLLDGLLSLLLFAGAMQLDLADLRHVRTPVVLLATAGVIISTLVTGVLLWLVAGAIGFPLSLVYALLFGALIAPTDPIAVLAILKRMQVSKKLYAGIGGESLLNDGVAIVVFSALLGVATQNHPLDMTMLVSEFVWSFFGGAGLGILLGLFTTALLRSVDDYKVEILLTLALASGGYVVAGLIATSGPIAIAIAGLLIGSQGRLKGAVAVTRRHLYMFWELLDDILNALLFLLMGLVLVIVQMTQANFMMGLIAIPILLIARFISVGAPITFVRLFRKIDSGTVRLLTWGGLRGGISIAMALSLPPMPQRDLILTMTYVVVVFSILVQGLTFPALLRRLEKA